MANLRFLLDKAPNELSKFTMFLNEQLKTALHDTCIKSNLLLTELMKSIVSLYST